MYRRFLILAVALLGFHLSSSAQQMKIENLSRMKAGIAGKGFETSRDMALLDLYTQENGFEFFAGNQSADCSEGDGCLTVSLPHKTSFIKVTHPEHGALLWKVPGKPLKKNRRYAADLSVLSLDKEFHVERQWIVVYTQPLEAVITIDSTVHRTVRGKIQAYLPLGEHAYKVESPFYEEQCGVFELADSVRTDLYVSLQPFYSYVEVDTHLEGAEIYLDGRLIGRRSGNSGRIAPGKYELDVIRDGRLIWNDEVSVSYSERKKIDFSVSNGKVINRIAESQNEESPAAGVPDMRTVAVNRPDTLDIKAFDDDTEILVNREKVGKGRWVSVVTPGTYVITSIKDGVESSASYVEVSGGRNHYIRLASPVASYGALNVSSDVIDALVWLDGVEVGRTPFIMTGLAVNRQYILKLTKDGYEDVETRVRLRGNEIRNIKLRMKKSN